MSKAVPQISKYMTTTPSSIKFESSIFEAMEVMQINIIRHLPVIKDGKLVGIFTATDACKALSDICERRFHA